MYPKRSVWWAVSLGLVGLTMGYTFVVMRVENKAFAKAHLCPRRMHCQECQKNGMCSTENCKKDCPACNGFKGA